MTDGHSFAKWEEASGGHWDCCTIVVVALGLRDRTKMEEAVFVESERLLTRTKRRRTACPDISSEASGVVGDCYLQVDFCVRARDLGVIDGGGMRSG